jgi:hypothetical protein
MKDRVMNNRAAWLVKTQGAAGLLAAAFGTLLVLAAPASLEAFQSNQGAMIAVRTELAAQASAPVQAFAARSNVDERPGTAAFPRADRSFHSIDEPAPGSGLPGGALALLLLAATSIFLLFGALLARSANPEQDRG